MKEFNLYPRAYLQGREAANEYDERQLKLLKAERERVLASKSRIGRAATKFAAVFYSGDLGTNSWLQHHYEHNLHARNSNTQSKK